MKMLAKKNDSSRDYDLWEVYEDGELKTVTYRPHFYVSTFLSIWKSSPRTINMDTETKTIFIYTKGELYG